MTVTVEHKCTSVGLRKLATFDAAGILGTLFSVVLHDAVEQKFCVDCGEIKGHIIPKPRELVAAIAMLRACNPIKLNGTEIKFLRKSLNLKAKELSGELGISAEHLSKIENDRQPIGEVYERLLRIYVCIKHLDAAHGVDLADLKKMLSMKIESVRLSTDLIRFDLWHGTKVEKRTPQPVDADNQKWNLNDLQRVG